MNLQPAILYHSSLLYHLDLDPNSSHHPLQRLQQKPNHIKMPKRNATQAFSELSAKEAQQLDRQSKLTLEELNEILRAIEETIQRLSAYAASSTPLNQIALLKCDRLMDKQLHAMAKKMCKAGIHFKLHESLLDMCEGMLKGCEDYVTNQSKSSSVRRRYRKLMNQIQGLKWRWRKLALSNVYGDIGPRKKYTSCWEEHLWGRGR